MVFRSVESFTTAVLNLNFYLFSTTFWCFSVFVLPEIGKTDFQCRLRNIKSLLRQLWGRKFCRNFPRFTKVSLWSLQGTPLELYECQTKDNWKEGRGSWLVIPRLAVTYFSRIFTGEGTIVYCTWAAIVQNTEVKRPEQRPLLASCHAYVEERGEDLRFVLWLKLKMVCCMYGFSSRDS